jgi:hypothetical protein
MEEKNDDFFSHEIIGKSRNPVSAGPQESSIYEFGPSPIDVYPIVA